MFNFKETMNITRKLPLGVQSFKVLRNDRYLYVDKTGYLFRLVQSGRVYFLSRPRRFGKSLFLSTLAAYFLGQKELFKELYLEKAEEEQAVQEGRAAWEEYPVLYFDFNTGQYDTFQSLISRIQLFLSPLENLIEKNTTDAIYIFEFKLSGNGTSQDAINQIRENDYATLYKAGEKKIALIGSSFDEKSRTIKDWAADDY